MKVLNLLLKKLHSERLLAQRIVVYHMRSLNLQPQNLPTTKYLLTVDKEASSHYRLNQSGKANHALKNDQKLKLQECNNTGVFYKGVLILKYTIRQLAEDAKNLSFEAKKKENFCEVKTLISKSNVLKCAVKAKQETLDQLLT